MKAILGCCLLALFPLQASALSISDNDLLSTIAMPLAVSAVAEVPGVQIDRVGQLVTYMDQANVPPDEFVDVFRYVPVALVLRTDRERQPDFVEWTHQQIIDGVTGPELVTVMERQLRTYDEDVPAEATFRAHRRYRDRDYAYRDADYAYRDAYEEDYVPVGIRHHCERLWLEPVSLIEMPVAVADVYDIDGLPYDRVTDFVTELNDANVPPVQFVEVMRYAPVAVVQPEFVPWVQTQVVSGVTGYSLVNAIDRQLVSYDIRPQIDLGTPTYYSTPNYYPQVANYVAPADPAFVPQAVQTRIARFAPSVAAPTAVATTPQVQRLLAAQSNPVVVNPGQARRELAHSNREIAAPQVATVPPMMEHGHGRGHVMAMPSAGVSTFAPPPQQQHGRGHEGRVMAAAPPQPVAMPPQAREHGNGNGNGNGHGRGHAVMAAPPAVAAPQPAVMPQQHEHGNGNGNGHGRGHAVMAAPPAAAAPQPVVVQPQPQPQAHEHGNGHGHGGPPPVAAAPPAAAPAPSAAPPANAPPGQEKNHGNGKGKH